MADVYDREIERLTQECERAGNCKPIRDSWYEWSPLFRSCHRDLCGECLTMVKNGGIAETAELTHRIQADERIPREVYGITLESLPAFAEWQRTLDSELGREPPE